MELKNKYFLQDARQDNCRVFWCKCLFDLKGEFSSNQEQNEKNKLKAVNIGPRAVYRIADDRMYENKRKSKIGRQ